ncbi:sulfatase-like hydrolase/transferase [Eggerthellaceae bacterium zg-997]|nr:sulfatase-like hydrolase/transferase [Eggerthellaceae bacterium zg-997]
MTSLSLSNPMFGRRAALAAFDAACTLCLAALASLALAPPAWAYVDPSVMTYTIQALAGVAVALSTVAGVLMRRTRRKLVRALGIDENRNKEVEPAVHRLDAQGRPVGGPVPGAAPEAGRARRRAGGAGAPEGASLPFHRPGWATRLALSLAVSAFVVFTVMIVAPAELVAGNEESLLFGLAEVWPVLIAPALIVCAALTAVLTVMRGRLFNLALLLLFGFGAACYVQVLFLNTGLPSADGQAVTWSNYTTITLVSLAVWIAVVVGPWALSRLNVKLVQSVAAGLALALIVVQGAGVASLFVDMANKSPQGEEAKANSYAITRTGLNTVSPKKNLIVFILDGFDTKQDLIPALKTDPHMLDEMTGFTWYQNSSPTLTPTREALPTMLSGDIPSPDKGFFRDDTTYTNTTYLADLKKAGYGIGLYSDTLNGSARGLFEHTVNGLPKNEASEAHDRAASKAKINENGTRKILLECALYRDLPWALKPTFWFYTDDINNAMVTREERPHADAAQTRNGHAVLDRLEPDPTPYSLNDKKYYDDLRAHKLALLDDGSAGAMRFIHLLGPHFPNTLDENVQEQGSTTRQQQARASMKIVSEYIRQLKEMGLYDNATIIITADHGYRSESNFAVLNGQMEMSPIMLVKQAGTAEQSAAPMKVSQNPVDTSDVMPTLVSTVEGLDRTNYAPDMEHRTDPDRVRRFYFCTKDANLDEIGFQEMKIKGDALDFSNWSSTGMVYSYKDSTWKQLEGTQEFQDDWLSKLYNYQ